MAARIAARRRGWRFRTSRPEPAEALRTTVAWSVGLNRQLTLLSSVQLDRFRTGQSLCPETEVRAERGGYFVQADLSLRRDQSTDWLIVADVNQEIDEARRMLKEMNGRIEYSKVKINYQSQSRSGAGFLEPIFAVLGSLGSILGWLIAILIVVTISLVPITLFVMAWRWAWHRGKTLVQIGRQPRGDS